ncbi:MAG: hypothetical protein HOO67_05025 [Candidatus Peribacteraceae bacterium]|nr:hypothetical protein [Candidatus Peribacteraceae bacterium]
MPIVPKFLQGTVNPILKKIVRSTLYTTRYNNSLDIRLNETYLRYQRYCSAQYASRHGLQDFGESRIRTHSAQIFPKVMPADKARQYSSVISGFIENNKELVKIDDKHSSLLKTIKHPLQTMGTDYLEIFKNPALHQALLAFFHGDYRLEWVSAFRTLPSTHIASSWNWHTDANPPYSCKVFLHLTSATAETGATDFMTPADTAAYRRAGYFGDQYGSERMGDQGIQEFAKKHNLPYRPFHFDVSAGDVSLFNQNFLHRAVAPRTGYRDVMEFFLLPNPVPWDEQLAKDGIDSAQLRVPLYPKNPRRA